MRAYLFVLLCLCLGQTVWAQDSLRIASTTSTQNSGLYDYLLPDFTAKTGIETEVIAVGTGQAIRIAQNGDADILIVHHRASEDAFVKEGYGEMRFDLMYNDFILVGPKDDPAGVLGATDLGAALNAIANGGYLFISRGDDSGTHKKEIELWSQAGLAPLGQWYREIGSGMGAALNMASAVNAYTLSDRGTWLSFGNKGELGVLFSGAEQLRNPYGLIPLNPERFAHIDAEKSQKFVDWILSKPTQKLIGEFQIDGKQLFCPNFPNPNTQGDSGRCPADIK